MSVQLGMSASPPKATPKADMCNELSPSAFGDVSSWNRWGKLDDVGTTDVAVAAATFPPLVYLFRKGLGDDKGIYLNVGEYPPR